MKDHNMFSMTGVLFVSLFVILKVEHTLLLTLLTYLLRLGTIYSILLLTTTHTHFPHNNKQTNKTPTIQEVGL